MEQTGEAQHDLLDAEAARLLLKMSSAKFELLVSTGRLPIFRSGGRTCFRREDISAIALKRQAVQTKPAKPRVNLTPAAPAREKGPDKYAVTRLTLSASKPAPARERIDDDTDEIDQVETVVAPRSERSVKPWMLASAIAAILVASVTFLSTRHENPPPVQTNSPVAFTRSKAAPGLVEAVSGERALSFEVGGKIHAVLVEEGQVVRVGDPIAELENADLVAKLKSRQADFSVAEAKLGILKGNLESDLKKAQSEVARLKAELALLEPRQEDIDQAKADMEAVEADAKRLAEDEQKYSDPNGRGKSWSVQLYDQAKGLSAAAAAKLASAKARLRALQAGSRPEEKERTRALLASAQAEMLRQQTTNAFEIQSAQAQVDQAQAQIDLAKAELEKARIVSSVTGTIVRKYMHPGEVIDALHPQPVVTVADMTRLRVRADVDEADFPRIRVGQRVKITADALEEGRSFPGTVESISPITGQKRFSTGDARERMDVKIVETVVKFDTPPPPQFVKLGLRVTALFEVAE
jgi:multidrug resistance efflux pump